jgi:deoxyadenosine/deoxycytidine kinase
MQEIALPVNSIGRTRLIVIDGLSGSGKSTTAAWLTNFLQRQGISIAYISEIDKQHPLWWYEYWDGVNYLTPNFDKYTIEFFIQTSLSKWKDFVSSTKNNDLLIVAESVFFQDALAMFLMGNADPDHLTKYAHNVQSIVSQLQPILIYFRQANVAEALFRICSTRGPGFEQELIENMEKFPYLRQRNLKGLKGIAVLWQDIQSLTDKLFNEYDIRKLALVTSGAEWSQYRRQILDFLGFSFE